MKVGAPEVDMNMESLPVDEVKDKWLIDQFEAFCAEEERIEKEGIVLEDRAFELVTREEWGALPPKKKLIRNEMPLETVVISFTTDILHCDNSDFCKKAMRALQRYHMKKGASDIVYNFMSCGDGKIYEGRGWNYKYSELWNYPSQLGSCLVIGIFGKRDDAMNEKWNPPEELILPVAKLINFGADDNYVDDPKNIYSDHENCFPLEHMENGDQYFNTSYYMYHEEKPKGKKVKDEYPDLDYSQFNMGEDIQ